MLHRCPICKAITDSAKDAEFPFCCDRCRQRDLGNWATEKYVVSDPIFNEDEQDSPKDARNTIILDLNEPHDSER